MSRTELSQAEIDAMKVDAAKYTTSAANNATAKAKTPTGDLMAAYKAAANKAQWLKGHPKFAAGHPELVAKNPAPKKEPALDAQTRLMLQNIKNKKLRKTIRNDLIAANAAATQTAQNQNPNQQTPFGGSSYDPETNTYTETLAPEQQDLLDQSQGLASSGMSAAGGLLEGYGQNTGGGVAGSNYGGGVGGSPYQYSMGDYSNERAATEDAVYGRLTKNFDRDMDRELEARKQELYNKGIPYSDDPNSLYQKQIGDITERYDVAKADARSRATEMGGSELRNAYDISSGAFNTNLGGMGQQMGDIQSLSQLGTGAIMPNLSGFQAPPATSTIMPSEFKSMMKSFGLTQQQIDQAWKIAVMQNDTARYGIDAQLKAATMNSESGDEEDEGVL